MSISLHELDRAAPPALSGTLRNAGVAGAGGAGFPSHAKWSRLDDVDHLLVNHQESEPNYYVDRWLGREHADAYAALFDRLLDGTLETVVVAAREADRDRWMGELEAATGGTVHAPADLPLDPDAASGVVFAYTGEKYQYGMERVLLRIVAGVRVGEDLPTDRGWLVQNTETLLDVYRALDDGTPVTRKYVHVDGLVPDHRFLEVPIGTPASRLLEAAGVDGGALADDQVLLDGGPGWCFEVERPPEAFPVRKRTNCLLVVDEKTAWEHAYGPERVNVREPYDWDGEHERSPTALSTERVDVPLVTVPGDSGVVTPSRPLVDPGDDVVAGEMIATPAEDDVGNAQHASISGTVTAVTDRHVTIEAGGGVGSRGTTAPLIYWSWCAECGEYIARPDTVDATHPLEATCEGCR